MIQSVHTVVGIDVGGKVKGFHAVALRDGIFVDKTTDDNPFAIVEWCCAKEAIVVAVDAPCRWSQTGLSRLAERELKLFGKKIHCFATPARERAANNTKKFYDWVFNGERLYRLLENNYLLFKGVRRIGPACVETFPQAIICNMEGTIISAKYKKQVRRQALKNRGYDTTNLSNIDFIDAALCAVAADEFRKDNYQCFGNAEEGFIVTIACRSV
jgi:predicted nuclease with RNAse H fold